MKKKGCLIGMVIGLSAVGVVAWFSLQPRMKFATRAEVEAVIDKRLLVPLPGDAKAAERYAAVEKLFERHKELKQPDVRDVAANLAWAQSSYARSADLLQKTLAIYESGPVHPPANDLGNLAFPTFARVKQMVKYTASAAEADAALGKTDEAVEKLRIGYRLTDAYLANSQTIIHYLVCMALAAILDRSTSRIVFSGALTKAQLAQLLNMLQPFDPKREILKRSIIGDFQGYTLPFLPQAGSDMKLSQEAKALSDEFGTQGGEVAGQYDALASARISSKVASSVLENADKPFPKIDRLGTAYRDDLLKGLPQDTHSTLPEGAEKKIREFWYRIQMNNTPNSLGRQMFAEWAVDENMLEAPAKASTVREALRAVVALEIYRLENGGYPEVLEQVVIRRVLPKEPWDYMADRPLQFDPKALVVYSVGSDLKDDGGVVSDENPSKEKDWGYRLRRISLIKPN